MTFNTKKYSGPVRKSVQVLCSDSKRRSYPLQVSALVGGAPPTVGLDPERGIDFERFAVDEKQEASIVITNYSPEPMHLSIIGAPPEYLLAMLSSPVVQPRESVELTVSTNDAPPLGRFASSVTLLIDESKNTRLTIPVSGVSMMK